MLIVALLILLISLALGISIVSKVDGLSRSVQERCAFGIPLGILLFTSGVFLADYLFGYPGPIAIGTVSALALLLIAALNRKYIISVFNPYLKPSARKKSRRQERFPKLSRMPLAVNIAAVTIFVIISIVFIRSFYNQNGSIYCVLGGCSDQLFHLGMGNSVAMHSFPPPYPYTSDVINIYPFMSDFYSALLREFGLGLVASVMVPNILLLFSAVSICAIFAYEITNSVFASITSLLIFWFGGSGLMELISYPIKKQMTFFIPSTTLLQLLPTGSGTVQFIMAALRMSTAEITYWTSIMDSMLILQRDLVLGLPLGLMALYLLYTVAFKRETTKSGGNGYYAQMAVLGLIGGLMPLVNPSTFVVLAVAGACAILVDILFMEHRQAVRKWGIAMVLFIVLAAAELSYLSMQQRQSNWSFFMRFPSTIYSGNVFLTALYLFAYLVIFWFFVVGLPIPLSALGLYISKKRDKLFFLPFLLLWALISVYSMQPDPADSNKVFIYVFFMISVFASYPLLRIYEKKKIATTVAVLLVLLLICYQYIFMFYNDVFMYPLLLLNPAQLSASSFITSHVPANAIFAESDYSWINPVPSTIASRVTLLSYSRYVGVVYTHPVPEVTSATDAIFATGNCSLIKRFNVSYLYLTPSNATSRAPFDNNNFTNVYGSYNESFYPNITIYKAIC